MFKFLRSQAKIFYWVIAATFILFLFLGGLTGRGCQAPGTRDLQAGIIGSINGTKIYAQHYDYAVRQQIALMRQQAPNRDLNANQYAQARQIAWDALIQNAIVEQAIVEMDLTVSDAEVLDVFQNNPPPELLDNYRDESGQIDMNRYYADLQNPEMDWTRAEEAIRSIIPRQKLNDLLAANAVVTEEEIREEYIRQTGKATAEYMGVVYGELESEYSPSPAEIQAYYDAHPDDYQTEASAYCKVVRYAKEASEADYEEIRVFITDIRDEIVSGAKDFVQAAEDYSEDGSASNGGDLGFFDRNRMVAPFTEAAFSLPVGEISQPVRTQFGYHLIEVLEQEQEADSDEVTRVKARHILLKVTPGSDTLLMIQESADEFRERVNGDTFVATAEAEALDLIHPVPFKEGRDISGLPLSVEGSNWVFAAQPGEVSPIFENREFFYIVLAGEKNPAGLAPLAEVTGQVTLALTQQHNLETARAKLEPAVGEVQLGRPLAEVAAEHGLKYALTDTFTMNGNIPDVGYGTDFNKEAILGRVGQIVPEVETLRGLFALVPVWIAPIDEEDFLSRRDGLRGALVNRARSEVVQEWFNTRLEEAEIVDLRLEMRRGV